MTRAKKLLGSEDDPESLAYALRIGAMGTPFNDYQGTLYMNQRYKADQYRDAEFRDYGLARAVRIILNNADDILSALASSERSGREAPTHRHKKTGRLYVLIGFGKIQSDFWMTSGFSPAAKTVDMLEVAVYRAIVGGSLWVRPREEFEDGRFIKLSEVSHEH